jgi:hypothetical protein
VPATKIGCGGVEGNLTDVSVRGVLDSKMGSKRPLKIV